jgi:hypothetical protein
MVKKCNKWAFCRSILEKKGNAGKSKTNGIWLHYFRANLLKPKTRPVEL